MKQTSTEKKSLPCKLIQHKQTTFNSFLFCRFEYDALVGQCFDDAFGTDLSVWTHDSIRRRRAFEDDVEAAARKQSTVDEAVDFFLTKTEFWNRKMFEEMVLARTEAAEDRKAAMEDRKAAEEERRAAREERRVAEEERKAAVEARNYQVSAHSELVSLIGNATCEQKYREYYFSDLTALFNNYWHNEDNRMADLKTWQFLWFQRVGVIFGAVISFFGTCIFKWREDRAASDFSKQRNVKVHPCQKVID